MSKYDRDDRCSQGALSHLYPKISPMETIDQEFIERIGRALDRLYDHAFLQTSPLTSLLDVADDRARGQALRRVLLEAAETLRPPEGTPYGHPAWRPYRILESRCVAGLTVAELCQELNLGKSQIYREYARAVDAVASVIWTRWGGQTRVGDPQPEDRSLLHTEIAELIRQEPPETLDVRPILHDLAQLLAPTFQARSIALSLSLSEEPLWVRSGPSVLRHSLLAPLSAATRWLAMGNVQVTGQLAGDEVEIDMVMHGTLTAEGQRAEGNETVNSFVEAVGGSVELDGVTMRIHLPALTADRQLLLVDNNPELALLFERYLEGEPWSLVYAATSEEAMAACQASSPSLIVLDVLMPGQDGWHFLAHLRRSPSFAHIPVAICSVLNEPTLALSLGADGYLQKPVSRRQLCDLLQQISRDPLRHPPPDQTTSRPTTHEQDG